MNTRLITLLSLCLFSFSSLLSAETDKPNIVVSITPLALLAKSVVGDKAEVTVLLPKKSSPHHYSLKASDRQQVLNADVVLWVGKDLETFLAKLIAQRSQGVITAMELSGMHWPEEGHSDHHHHDGHDPHLWMNPLNNQPVIDALVAQLEQLDPKHTAYYRANADKAKQALSEIDGYVKEKLAPYKAIPFIVAHPAYGHFVERYQLTQLDYVSITPERRSGAKHLLQLRRLKQVKCLFADYAAPSKAIEQLGEDLSAPVHTLDPLGGGLPAAPSALEGVTQLIAQLADDFHSCLSAVH